MKDRLTRILLIALTTGLLLFSGCKKSVDPANTMPALEGIKVENSDIQDAIADKNEMEIDNTMDQLQVSNYSTSNLKDFMVSGTRTITVDHPDSTTFPKVITIVYTNFQDSTATESFVKNGEIDITVNADPVNKQLSTRVQVFKNFSISTEGSTVSVSGTRTVERTGIQINFNGMTSLRVVATDHIVSYLKFAITKTGTTDSLKFTRTASRVRNAFLHFENVGGITWQTIRFRNVHALDTLTWTGTITGLNEMNESYSKNVMAEDPVTMIFYKGTPVLASGTVLLTVEGNAVSTYRITFSEDPDHPHLTLVTIRNNETMKVRTFVRLFNRKFIRWW